MHGTATCQKKHGPSNMGSRPDMPDPGCPKPDSVLVASVMLCVTDGCLRWRLWSFSRSWRSRRAARAVGASYFEPRTAGRLELQLGGRPAGGAPTQHLVFLQGPFVAAGGRQMARCLTTHNVHCTQVLFTLKHATHNTRRPRLSRYCSVCSAFTPQSHGASGFGQT